ncbi:acyl transferase domain-containing protein [Streptomyces sp. LBL]|uniref:type I polyketide synthase n=1 Tax=Streptomyces sp. LBL TaxID=2940562 RepID=UPI0024748DCA|nr:type I polyketide synthase [Streptomyces sp. LBL]MDH6626450.1 acyl transferase domain-containing protein [Streptomyces sp. LBL]
MSTATEDGTEPIAVVGLAGRLPGSPTMEAFWRNQRDGVESVSRFSTQQLADAGWPTAMVNHPDYVPAAAVIENADHFDAEFFGYTREQAEISDPQQRIFAECAWHALEDTGHDPSRFDGAVGVYAGCFANKYLPLNLLANARFRGSMAAFSARPYNDKDFLATRAAYLCDLRGPAMTVQAACSTSLVAIHLACQSLLGHECDMALAGGVALPIPLIGGYPVVAGGIFARDGHCRPFDAAANGTVPGYGVTVVALRRLSDALADNDNIRAVILGSALNNDGSAKFGFSAPSMQAQAEVIATAQAVADVPSESIGYIEAHGTGTPLGDPIELAGLTKAFNTSERGFCAIGSTKANIGHLDAAAGAAGFARAVLALEHGEIPPSINFDTPNPALLLDRTPFYVPTTARPWPRGATPRRAGVSAFAVGGTNAHIVLQEAPTPPPSPPNPRDQHVLVLSARSEKALADAATNLADRLDGPDDLDLADVAYTLQVGRRAFPLRRHLVCHDRAEATAALRALAQPGAVNTADDLNARQVAFMFPGSTSHRPDAAAAICRSEPAFAREVDRCAELAQPLLGYDLRGLLFPSTWDGPQTGHDDPRGLPAAAFTLQWALARLWQAWGVQPTAMIGEGDGEYVAACLAGVIDLADAIAATATDAEIRSHAGATGPLDAHATEFAAQVARYELKPPQIPYISQTTGTWTTPQDAADPAHWARHLNEPTRFAKGLRTLADEPGRILLEVGPDSTLTDTLAQQQTAEQPVALPSLTPTHGSRSDLATLLDTVGKLWQATADIDWDAFRGPSRPRRLSLPGYPFQRTRYWIGPDSGSYQPLGLEETSWTSRSLPS